MSNHIIETIGSWGVKTTPMAIRQFAGPKPGDAILFPDNAPYPWTDGGTGRVASIDTETGKIAVCARGGSVFLNEDASVSISGGPFGGIDPADLEPAGYVTVSFWNWGDNPRAADMGVDYLILRPAFKLIVREP